MSIMLLFCQPLDITSPVGNNNACEWYCLERGASARCDQPPVVGLYDQQGSPAPAPPERNNVPSGKRTGFGFTREVGCVCPGAIGKFIGGCHSGERLERLMIWKVRLLFRFPPPIIITRANGYVGLSKSTDIPL